MYSQIGNMQSARDKKIAELPQIFSTVTARKDELELQNNELAQTVILRDITIQRLEKTISELEKRRNSSRSNELESIQRLDALKKTTMMLEHREWEIKYQGDRFDGEIKRLTDDLNLSTSMMKTMVRNLKHASETISRMAQEKRNLEIQLKTNKRKSDSANRHQTELKEKTHLVERLTSKVNDLNVANDNLKTKLEESVRLYTDLQQKKCNCTETNIKYDDVVTTLKAKEKAFDELKSELETLNANFAENEDELLDQQNYCKQIEADNEELSAKLAERIGKIDRLEGELNNLRNDHQNSIQQLVEAKIKSDLFEKLYENLLATRTSSKRSVEVDDTTDRVVKRRCLDGCVNETKMLADMLQEDGIVPSIDNVTAEHSTCTVSSTVSNNQATASELQSLSESQNHVTVSLKLPLESRNDKTPSDLQFNVTMAEVQPSVITSTHQAPLVPLDEETTSDDQSPRKPQDEETASDHQSPSVPQHIETTSKLMFPTLATSQSEQHSELANDVNDTPSQDECCSQKTKR